MIYFIGMFSAGPTYYPKQSGYTTRNTVQSYSQGGGSTNDDTPVICSPDSVTTKGNIARFKLDNGMLRYFPTDAILFQWMTANNPVTINCNSYPIGPDMAPNLVICSSDSVTSKGAPARFKLNNGIIRYFPTPAILLQWVAKDNPITVDCKPYSQGPDMTAK